MLESDQKYGARKSKVKRLLSINVVDPRSCHIRTTTLLVHAATGGAGRILCQWANKIDARVIGTVGSEEKMDVARGKWLCGGTVAPG